MEDQNLQIIKDDEIDLRTLFQVLWFSRKRILHITLIITFLGILYAFFATPLYKSTITMYPASNESGGNLNQLKGMASNFGLDIGGAETSFHIPDIVQSRRIKTELIYNKWNSDKFDFPVNLIQFWEINQDNKFNINPLHWIKALFANKPSDPRPIWEESAITQLDERITVGSNQTTGLITVDVLMEEPNLSSELVNAIYPSIIEFTIETHTQQVKLNRQFIEERQNEVKVELKSTEEQLKEFRQRNRNVSESPELQLELERLMREVEIQTQVYITLQQQYEIVRIEEVKETPSVIILDEGKPPVKKSKPNRKLILIFSIFIGVSTGIGVILIKRFLPTNSLD